MVMVPLSPWVQTFCLEMAFEWLATAMAVETLLAQATPLVFARAQKTAMDAGFQSVRV
jgi:hypothetical protein